MSPNAALAFLRRRWWLVAGLVLFVAGMVWIAQSALRDGAERRASRERIESLARVIEQQNALILGATGPEAQARSAATLGRAIAELRRSIDCVALYVAAERPPACAEVSARMDALIAGLDPFTRPPPQTGAP